MDDFHVLWDAYVSISWNMINNSSTLIFRVHFFSFSQLKQKVSLYVK